MSWVFWCLVNGQLPFVGWVEGNFNNFRIFLSDRLNRTHHQLTAFEKCWFGSISSSVALEDWTIFTGKEDSAITESSNATKISPGFIILNYRDDSRPMSHWIGRTILYDTSKVLPCSWYRNQIDLRLYQLHESYHRTTCEQLSFGSNLQKLVIVMTSPWRHYLSKGTSFVWANSWCWSQSFDSFQILDQTVFLCHSFGSQSQTDRDSGKETFWDICDNDTWIRGHLRSKAISKTYQWER